MENLLKRFYRSEVIEEKSFFFFFFRDLSMDQRRLFRTWVKKHKKSQEVEKEDGVLVKSLEASYPHETSRKGRDRELIPEKSKLKSFQERSVFSICPLELKRLPRAKFTGRLIVVRNVEDDRAACEALLESARSEGYRKSSSSSSPLRRPSVSFSSYQDSSSDARLSSSSLSSPLPPSLSSSPLQATSLDGALPSFSCPKREDEELLLGYDSEHEPRGAFLDSTFPSSLSLFSSSSPRPPLSLIQLSSASVACIWQLRHLGGLPRHLVSLLVREDIRKITQGASSEVQALQTEFGILPRNFMCLHVAAISLGCANHSRSLQALSGIFLGKYVDKALQLSHWSKKELSQEELVYAATDAYVSRQVLLGMRKKREDAYIKLLERQARVDGLLFQERDEKDDQNQERDREGGGGGGVSTVKRDRKISVAVDHRPPDLGEPGRFRDEVPGKIENPSACLQVHKIPDNAGVREETSEKESLSTVYAVDRIKEKRALSEGVSTVLSDVEKTEEIEGNPLQATDMHDAEGNMMIRRSRLCSDWLEERATSDPFAQGIATLSLPKTQAKVPPGASTACRSSDGDKESLQLLVARRGMGKGEQERWFVGTSPPERRKSSLSVEYCSQLKALCLEKGWKLSCDRLESSRTGFKSVFSVNCGLSGQWTAKSKIAHTTLRDAQNDAAEQLLLSLKARQLLKQEGK